MKGRKRTILTFILAAFTASVWGTVIWRWYTPTTITATEPVEAYKRMESPVVKMKDSVVLIANYRDPFLEDGVTQPPSPPKKRISNQTKSAKPVTNRAGSVFAWPKMRYGGIVKNTASDHALAFLQVNAQHLLVTEGQQIGDIHLVAISPDSVQLRWRGHARTLYTSQTKKTAHR